MLEIEKYVVLALNEIRGEIKRDDALVNAFCSIVALMSYKSYIESLYSQHDSYFMWIGKKSLDEHPYLNEIKRSVDEILEEKKSELLSLSSYNVYSFNEENEHVDFIKNNTTFRHNNGIHQIMRSTGKSNISNFSVLFVRTEEIESNDEDDSEIEYFNSYLIVNFVLNRSASPKHFNSAGGTFMETKFEKTDNVHKLLGEIELNFNNNLTQNSSQRTFSDILRNYIEKTRNETIGLNYEKIKSHIEKTISDDKTNKFLSELRRIFNHELTHWKQKLGTFKRKIISSDNTNKRFRKVNVLRNNWGLPEVPARKRERDRLDQGDLYDKVFRDGSMTRSQAQNVKARRFNDPTNNYNVDHELRPQEFYPRLGDTLDRLKNDSKIIKLLNRSFIIDKDREKIKVSVYWDHQFSSLNSSEAINTFFKIFIQNNTWLSYLRRIKNLDPVIKASLGQTGKRAERYYKKAISELYKEYISYINNHKRTMISLYKKNKTKILKDVEDFRIKGKGIYINNNYLKEIDNVTIENIERTRIHRELYSNPLKDQEIDEVFNKINFNILNGDHIKIAARKFNPESWSGEVENFWLDIFDEFEKIIKSGDLNKIEELHHILEFIYAHHYGNELGDLAIELTDNPVFEVFY